MTVPLEHKHLIVRAEVNDPPKDPDLMDDWMSRLVGKIGMKILRGPISVYSEAVGNRGMTSVTIIETSHLAVHVWDECSPALVELDVYSCQEFDLRDVMDCLDEFDPVLIEKIVIDRKHSLQLLKE